MGELARLSKEQKEQITEAIAYRENKSVGEIKFWFEMVCATDKVAERAKDNIKKRKARLTK